MTSLTRGQIFEVVFWIPFAIAAFAMTFTFDRELEIYKFGAAAWPRGVLLLIVLAALGQLFQDIKQRRRLESASEVDTTGPSNQMSGHALRLGITLLLPVIYASLLDTTGFYFTTPIFIALYLYVNGEHRVRWLVGVTLLIYVLLVFFFAKLLRVGLPVGYAEPFYSFSNWLLVLIQ